MANKEIQERCWPHNPSLDMDNCLSVIDALDERIKKLEKQIEFLAGENADAKLLMTIPGVGYFSALAILAEIGDIHRFSSSEELSSYAA